MTSREVAESITLCGVHFPRGAVVYIDIHGIQRDARYWEDPDAFKPERFLDRVRTRRTRRPCAMCMCVCYSGMLVLWWGGEGGSLVWWGEGAMCGIVLYVAWQSKVAWQDCTR